MKKLKHSILALLSIIFMVSCSSDDGTATGNNDNNGNNNSDGTPEANYFPSTIGSFWNYDVSSTDNSTSETTNSTDSLYVATQTESMFTLDVNNGLPANGPIIGLLSSGTLTKSNTALTIDGALELPDDISNLIDLDIALDNFVLYNTEANNNTQLASSTNTVTQDFNGFPLTITYLLTSTALNFDNNLTLNGVSYPNVVSSKITLNIEVSTVVNVGGISIPLSVLEPQDILVSTNYYAEGIGLVQANSETNYEISTAAVSALDVAGVDLGIPTSGSTTIDQVISNYNIEE